MGYQTFLKLILTALVHALAANRLNAIKYF